jgi:hypothetical protein
MKARSFLAVAVLGALLAVPSLGAEPTDDELLGAWRRDDGRIFRIERDVATGELTGAMIDPPENSVTHLKYSVALHLRHKESVLLGKAVWTDQNPKKGQPDQPDSWTADALWDFELVSPGKLKGKSEAFSFGRGKVTDKDWDNHTLEKLPRIDAPATLEQPQPLGAGAQLAALDWKRDDGLYLKLTATGNGGYTGELVTKAGESRARVELAVEPDGKLTGRAVFTVDGAAAEAHWEMSAQADGTLDARCEWLDWDAASKSAITRGVAARKFKPMRRIG